MAATTCANCGETCNSDDLFCERCGYDFITGSLPSATQDSQSPAAGGIDVNGASDVEVAASLTADMPPVPSLVDPSATSIPKVKVKVSADEAFFKAMVTEGEVSLPDPLPPEHELELFGEELHIGRTSDNRGVHPNIDIEALTGDPAVSTKHAVLRVALDGSHTITDVGSTNGTFVDDFGGEPVTQGIPIPIGPASVVYVGAWTKLQISTP